MTKNPARAFDFLSLILKKVNGAEQLKKISNQDKIKTVWRRCSLYERDVK